MNIFMACPAPAGSLLGNRVTATRWAQLLRQLGHRVTIAASHDGRPHDLLVALHARKSFPAVREFHRLRPRVPVVVALTGTDLYRDLRISRRAAQSLDWADLLVVLQPRALDDLPPRQRRKARVILQSTEPVANPPTRSTAHFDVCVLGHLRREKDPFRAALAVRLLPDASRVRITHAGRPLSPAMASRARSLMTRDARYRWVGELPRWRARRLLAGSHLLVLSSLMEGGANVISEAAVDGVPVLASRIPGSVGLLGARYPGFYPVGGTAALARLLARAESEAGFYRKLVEWCARLAPQFDPARERESWRTLLDELAAHQAGLTRTG